MCLVRAGAGRRGGEAASESTCQCMILARARSHWRRPLGEELMQPVLPALAQRKESSAYTQKTYRPLHAMCRPRRRPFSPTYAGPVSGVSWVSICHWRRCLMFSGKYRCRLYLFSRQMSRHDMTFRLIFLRQISRQDTTLHARIKEYFSARAAHPHCMYDYTALILRSACCSAASRLPVG